MTVRLAGPGDDAAIARLMAQVVMPGGIGLTSNYPASYFAALELEGEGQKTLVAERGGKIVAAASVTRRTVYLGGVPTEVGYLASLRVAPEGRGLTVSRGYRRLRELHEEELRLPLYLTSIMRDNAPARRILTSGRGGLPRYRQIGGYTTAVIPAWRSYPAHAAVRVRGGEEAGSETVFRCLERYGRARDFFPVLDRQRCLGGSSLPKGLALGDFLVAYRGEEAVGVVALWDQSCLRSLVVTRYSGSLRLCALVDRIGACCTGGPFLPPAGTPFAPRYLSLVAVQGGDPEVFRALVAAALTGMRRKKEKLLVVGLFEDDPLCTTVNAFYHLPFRSDIYSVAWEHAADSALPAPGRCYLDAGSL